MTGMPFHTSILARDRKLFLEMTAEEADEWIPRVFDRIRPHMAMINALVYDEEDEKAPLNLELMLSIAGRSVREVAVEMANELLTPTRQQQLVPLLNVYCDELLVEARDLDATFVQQGLIGIQRGIAAGQNMLLVEVCMRSIFQQVSLINGNPLKPPRSL